MMSGTGFGDGVFGLLVMVVFWGGLVLIPVALVVRGWGGTRHADGETRERPGAREILEERFAKGEISENEFDERRRVLEGTAR